MTEPIIPALRLLSRFWLEEVQTEDVETIAGLPELAETLPRLDGATLADLAVAYQRLFGFNLPPYESVFIDPSVMLLAPATARVQALYRRAHWRPPDVRVGAPDHLGLELLALADWLETGLTGLARRLLTDHLALWSPALLVSLRRLAPPPFYEAVAELTVELVLTTLPAEVAAAGDPFPSLPPPPVYTDQGIEILPVASDEAEAPAALPDLVKQLLTPCRAGLYLAREDIARLGRALELPLVVSERSRMLETLFRQAAEYELAPALLDQVNRLLDEAETSYRAWAEEYPPWTPYADAWCDRLDDSRSLLALL